MQNRFIFNGVFHIIIFLSTMPTTFAQEITQLLNIPFQHDDNILSQALIGGLNNPQFSELDLNNDGIQDLLVFDRDGFVPLTFINGGTPNTIDYTYDPSYQDVFPVGLNGWVAPRDYNGDGVMDLFTSPITSRIQGVAVYRGYYENDRLQFEEIRFPEHPFDVLYFPFMVGNLNQFFEIFIPSLDYPAVDDIDNDGDMDILAFNPGGSYIEWYKNISVEEGYGTDSLIYRLADECWGGIYESDTSIEAILSSAPGECANPLIHDAVDSRHAGSTLLTLDYNGDGVKEVVIGDLSSDHLNLLINSGTLEQAWISEQVTGFPIGDDSINISTFPAAFYVDVNNDGHKDLLAASNETGRGDNYENAWLYINTGTTHQPIFELQTKTFLIEQMVDVGSHAHPVFVDVNGDELLDIIIGNSSIFSDENNKNARIYYYENIGTATNPIFQLMTNDWMDFSQFNTSTFDFAPAFGDLDGDGDQDLLVGDDNGVLFYSKNKGGAGNPMIFDEFTYEYMDLDVGKAARPQLIDLNQDGLLDIVIGERGGNNDANGACGTLNYFQNIGTATEPMFSIFPSMPNSTCLGQVFTIPENEIISYSSPVFWDFGDRVELFVGTDKGGVKHYSDVSTDPDVPYTLLTESFFSANLGYRLSPTLADINNDGFLDFLIGNARGGLSLFTSDIEAQFQSSTADIIENLHLKIYPNPATEQLLLSFANMQNMVEQLEFYNVNGQLIHRQSVTTLSTSIDVSQWIAGIYVLRVLHNNSWSYKKVVVK